ncbi:zeta toxin family protein [Dentiradicibacter hellwigii]|mgnify:FL=1|jgi:hypothetical protein|uniref:Zeta toxin family protein n=1 Tax=Dentiradicibacter hellwigii TaxID=3149053 RepID=A0ABV4UF59_9RHOO
MNLDYKLSEEQHEAIYVTIASYYLPKSKAQDAPCAIITGGRPGAGKSGITAQAIERFRDTGYVLVDADKLRSRHTDYMRLMCSDDKTAANPTSPSCDIDPVYGHFLSNAPGIETHKIKMNAIASMRPPEVSD